MGRPVAPPARSTPHSGAAGCKAVLTSVCGSYSAAASTRTMQAADRQPITLLRQRPASRRRSSRRRPRRSGPALIWNGSTATTSRCHSGGARVAVENLLLLAQGRQFHGQRPRLHPAARCRPTAGVRFRSARERRRGGLLERHVRRAASATSVGNRPKPAASRSWATK